MAKRPHYSDENLARQVAQKFLPQLTRWTEGYGTTAQLETELADAIQRTAPLFDGYALAHYLEKRYQWASDAQLVDFLEGVGLEAESACRTAVAEWVQANGIRPKKVVGDLVDMKRIPTDQGSNQIRGEIVAIDKEQAKYLVFVAGRGHVRDGMGIRGNILPFEDFHELAAAPEEFVLSPQ